MKNQAYPLYESSGQLTTLRQLIEQKARECPDDVCFRFCQKGGKVKSVSYRAFYEDVCALGNNLLRHRIYNRRIAILGENSYSWLVTYFALVTTGNVAVLIAKDAADAEISTMLFQTETDIVLYSNSCVNSVAYCKAIYGRRKHFYPIEKLQQRISRGRSAIQRGRNDYKNWQTDPEKACTIFFTSGSTGFSKGVMISQTNICSNISNTLQLVVPKGPILSVLPFHHAFGLVTCALLPVHAHAEVFLCSRLSNFMREIVIAKPRTLGVVPLFVEVFSKTIWRTAKKEGQEKTLKRGIAVSNGLLRLGIDRRRQLFRSVLDKFGGRLECIVCGGAPLDPQYVKEFRSLGVELLNGYGITECSPVLAANRMYHHLDGSVGQILPQTELKIVDPDSEGNGEIVVRGSGVMLGYYNDPQSTAQVLDQDGWFHTGDLGHVDDDGFLFVTGRKKSLIILANGENVSPEELEQYVSRIDEVQEVVVYEKDHAITAEVYPEESDLSPAEVRKRIQKEINKLNAKLPNHKHIQKLKIRATEFEKTATRKIKRFKAAERDQ